MEWFVIAFFGTGALSLGIFYGVHDVWSNAMVCLVFATIFYALAVRGYVQQALLEILSPQK
jgi:hypothetical protein